MEQKLNSQHVNENKMGYAPVLPLIISMSLPAMFSMLIQALYNIVDSIFVANYDPDALTAVNLAFPIQMLMIAVAVGTGIGINSLVSRRLGEGSHEEASHAATHGIVLGVASWVVFAVLGLFFAQMFFSLFTQNSKIMGLGTEYLQICMIFSMGVFVEINIEKTLQATGNMMYPMVCQLSGAITNLILDPILIFGFNMGIQGAAIATVAGQILAMVFSVFIILTKNHEVHISFKNFKLRGKTIKDIYAVGVPSIIMQSIGAFMVSALNGVLRASDAAVNILGIYYKLQSFVFMPVFGLTHGVMPIMGYNYGARNKQRLVQALKYGCIIAVVIMAAGTLIFWMIPGLLIQIYNPSAEMMRLGVGALRIISLSFIPAALGILFSSLFQAVGMGIKSLCISVLRQLVIILPVAFLLSLIEISLVWYAFPIAEVVSMVASILLFIGVYKKQIRDLVPFNFEEDHLNQMEQPSNA